MRFKKYILLSLVLCGFAACSDDNEIEIPKAPVLEKAQLALAIKSEEGAVTKAGETTPTDADVNLIDFVILMILFFILFLFVLL